ncbi:hypothetical protein QUF75_05005 [Desulfococcaceae bacterium HSG7]|nr:hypothetical protein [Desulfococcaceae bacterium HSG7]
MIDNEFNMLLSAPSSLMVPNYKIAIHNPLYLLQLKFHAIALRMLSVWRTNYRTSSNLLLHKDYSKLRILSARAAYIVLSRATFYLYHLKNCNIRMYNASFIQAKKQL